MKQIILFCLLVANIAVQAQEIKTINYPNGNIYVGQVNTEGVPNGKGKATYIDGFLYEGNWYNGNPEGKGRLVQWKTVPGKADTTDIYEGDFVVGVMTGNGTYTKVGKWIYVGGFSGGKYNGKGKKTYTNGQFIDGEWKNGELVSGTNTVTSLLPYKISEWDSKSGRTIDKYGYKTEDGDVVISPIYDDAKKFSEGLAAVRTSVLSKDYTKDWGYINIQGNVKIDFKYGTAFPFSEGLAAVGTWDKENRITIYSYIDKTGKQAFTGEYEYARNFSEGLAAVVKDKKYGYIDKKGKVIIPFEYEYAWEFKEDRAIVRSNKGFKYGLIDKKGKLLTPFEYESISEFKDGMAIVEKGGTLADSYGNRKYGYIDKTGKLVIPVIYDFAGNFEKGKAHVELDGRSFYINEKGQEVEYWDKN